MVIAEKDVIEAMFENAGLCNYLVQEHAILKDRIENGRTAISGGFSPKKRARLQRMLNELDWRRKYLERVYVIVVQLPLYLLEPETVLEKLVQVVASPPKDDLGFESNSEYEHYLRANGDKRLEDEIQRLLEFPMDYPFGDLEKFNTDVLAALRMAVDYNFSRREEVFPTDGVSQQN